MSSSMDLPSIQTNFPSYSSSARIFHPSSTSSSPVMHFQGRSNSTPSLSSRLSTSSLHSQYSSSSDRSLSCSPGPSTPCDFMSRSPSFSHDFLPKPLAMSQKHHSMPAPFSSVLPQPKGYHPSYPSSFHNTPSRSQYHGQALPSPRDIFPSPTSRDHADYHHRESLYHVRGDRSPYGGSGDYFSRPTSVSSYHHPLPTPTTPTAMETKVHPLSPGPLSPLQVSACRSVPSPFNSPVPATASARMMMMMDEEYKCPVPRSPSVMSDRESFSPESSPFPSEKSFMGSSSSSNPQLLLCPVCSRAFKPSKNQNCNLRRHLKNVHNMSPTMHPRKCKWDSLPDGRVKDDKDRKERTRKSKRLWARKFRLRRKVEEAAVVLSMLSQAM